MRLKYMMVLPIMLAAPVAMAKKDPVELTNAYIQASATHNLFEQELNTLALSKASNGEVLAIAQELVDQHRLCNTELTWALSWSKIDAAVMNVRMTAYQQKKLSELRVKSGRAFDSAYLDIQANEYDEVLPAYEDYIDDGEEKFVVDHAKKFYPVLKEQEKTLSKIKLY